MVGRTIFCAVTLSILTAAAFADEPVQRCPCCGQTLPPGVTLTNVPVPAVEAPAETETLTKEKSVPRDWEAGIYGGFSASRGNTTSSSYNYGGGFEKKNGKLYRYKLKLDGRYRETDNSVSESKAEAAGEMRRLMRDSRWFTSGRLSVMHDDLKDLSYRIKIGPGIGRYLADTKTLTADIGTGFLYVRDKVSGEESDYIAWRLSQRLDWQVTETLTFWVGTDFFTDVADNSNYQIAFTSGLDNKINRHLSLMVELDDEYDSLPDQADKIKKNDLEFRTGVRYHF